MKQYIITLLVVLRVNSIYTQVTEDWVSTDPYYGKNGIRTAVDFTDNVFTLSHIFMGDMYLAKRDVNGNILWSTGYDNTTPSQWEVASDIAIDINGDAIITGYTNTGFGSDWYPVQMVTMKFNGEDGALLWRKTFNTGSAYRGRKVLTDVDGNIYVGGELNAWMIDHNEVGNMMVKKYDPDGNEIWTVTTNETGSAMYGPLHALKFDSEGNIIIAGASSTAFKSNIAKITAAGVVLWSKSFDSYGFSDVSVDPTNNIFALYTYSFGTPPINMNPAVKKFSSTGTELWSHDYDFGSAEIGRQIICDNIGGAFITGYGSQLTGMPYVDWITFRINAAGNKSWDQRYNEHANNDEWPRMMVKDAADNIYITGQGGPWPGYFWTSLTQMITVKYQSDGTEEWVALHTEFSSVGEALCLASDNSIYATGQGYAVTIHYTQEPPILCEPPVGLFTNNITTIKARLNWTLVPGAVQYEVWYKKTAAASWKKKFVPGINNKLNLKNLVCNTNYVWKIRTICDTAGVDLVSEFSPDQFFTTLVCRDADFAMNENNSILIYPNPAIAQITINTGDVLISDVIITDLAGRIIKSSQIDQSGTVRIPVNEIPSGTYMIHIQTTEEIINQQIIIAK